MGRRRLKHEWSAQPDVPEKSSRMKKESLDQKGRLREEKFQQSKESGNQMSRLRSKWISGEVEEGEFRMKRLASLQADGNKAVSKEG